MILEIPVTIWLKQPVNNFSLLINVAFPPLLLFLIVLFTRVPSEANTLKIIEGIEEISFKEKKRQQPFLLRQPAIRGGTMNFVFGLIYTATFLLSFGLIVWGLRQINFNIVSIIIFLFFFLSLGGPRGSGTDSEISILGDFTPCD